ncbi:hypothetical protein [Lentibacter algarum]|uniref:hypothetical protein n=1 Tax=Lentibacter algarum TaxID=576131 RepID=UPI00235580E6|nr:hypothetical protein [Lentibacter algarum]
MSERNASDKWLGLIAIALAVLLVFVWIPLDTETGLIEKVRRQVRLGDSLGPVVAGCLILIGGVLTFLRPNPQSLRLIKENLCWLGLLCGVIAVSLLLMRHAGPLVTALVTDTPYRTLRATPPWNYIGYLTGGTCLVAGLISIVRRRFSMATLAIGLAASLTFALLYDVPFDDLQLPPNGDV